MDNYAIADNFALLGKLMDIHGDNSFKAKSYSSAAFTIEKLPMQLHTLPQDKIFSIKGIGESVGQKIIEQLQTGQLQVLNDYMQKTPQGIVEMLLYIKGLRPKKTAPIWKEMEIETIGELLYACNENRLTLFKGFGEKTQNSVKESINFYMGTLGSYLYQQIESYAIAFHNKLVAEFANDTFLLTGAFRRQIEVIEKLEWVTTAPLMLLKTFFINHDFILVNETNEYLSFKGKENVTIGFYCTSKQQLYKQWFATSCSQAFLQAWEQQYPWDDSIVYNSEDEIFEKQLLPVIPAAMRETAAVVTNALHTDFTQLIQPQHIKGIIHSHSKWSDGVNSIEEMAKACMDKGFEYLVISDHSKTAAYAQGLQVERVYAQHQQIDELNSKLAPFKIFKSIESDILGDGSLDYDNQVLASFDLVIASVHSNLKMTEEKAMMRVMNAITNPFTSILGHPTGRLLLSRNGYPLDHTTIIDACAAHNVVIELNAHPRRLDIDWRWIEYAMEKGVLISIDPDAHEIEGFDDCRYGVLVAQKAGVTPRHNLSSYTLQQFEAFVAQQQQKR